MIAEGREREGERGEKGEGRENVWGEVRLGGEQTEMQTEIVKGLLRSTGM